MIPSATGHDVGTAVRQMGPSGCGKSILMDVLAGRRTGGTLQGAIQYDGWTPSQGFLHWSTGYVEQFSTLIENLTVFEMLMYTAELKVKHRRTRPDAYDRV